MCVFLGRTRALEVHIAVHDSFVLEEDLGGFLGVHQIRRR